MVWNWDIFFERLLKNNPLAQDKKLHFQWYTDHFFGYFLDSLMRDLDTIYDHDILNYHTSDAHRLKRHKCFT